MNCTEAKVLLAEHREFKIGDVETAELDLHLEQCSTCREVLARYSLIGEQVRALPPLEPSPDMHTKLMRALAAEHSQFMLRSPSEIVPPPEFLKPYLREHAHSSHTTDPLAVFTTADTGPLPILSQVHPKRRRSSIRQYAAIGLAAAFLMTLMMGGITSLLLLAHDHLGPVGPAPVVSINHPADVVRASYTTDTMYKHVVSAVADDASIYYTAYSDGANDGWMLSQLDRATKISTPLLATVSSSPLIVLGSNYDWLVWIQLDATQISTHGTIPNRPVHTFLQTWSLRYLSLIPQSVRDNSVPNQPRTLLSGTFDQNTTPGWVHTPVQGIWFIQNTLLVAMVDNSGVSHLVRYPLDENSNFSATEIAKAEADHLFTSPTANSDGTQIYWGDEWRTDDGNLHSNIWTQQVVEAPVPAHGKAVRYLMTIKQLFSQNGMSFRPAVVNNALFLLSTANGPMLTQATPTTTPVATSTSSALATVVATPNTNTPPTTAWANSSFYTQALDAGIHGTLLMFRLVGSSDSSNGFVGTDSSSAVPTIVGGIGSTFALQAGRDFVLWQSDDGSYGMFDARSRTPITVGEVLVGAQFLAVNGDTAVWSTDSTTGTPNNSSNSLATLMAFDWPRNR
ncbi:MAG: hypothetical protein NVSMB27_22810 [Ktedonobacteraceae bacterium]